MPTIHVLPRFASPCYAPSRGHSCSGSYDQDKAGHFFLSHSGLRGACASTAACTPGHNAQRGCHNQFVRATRRQKPQCLCVPERVLSRGSDSMARIGTWRTCDTLPPGTLSLCLALHSRSSTHYRAEGQRIWPHGLGRTAVGRARIAGQSGRCHCRPGGPDQLWPTPRTSSGRLATTKPNTSPAASKVA